MTHPGGRPPLPIAERHQYRVRTSLRPVEFAAARRAARRHGQTVAGWLRDLVVAAIAAAEAP